MSQPRSIRSGRSSVPHPVTLPSDPSTPRATALACSSHVACSRYHGKQPTAAISCSYRSPHRLPARPPTTMFQDVLLTVVTPEHLSAPAGATGDINTCTHNTDHTLRTTRHAAASPGAHADRSRRGTPPSVLHLYPRIPNWQMATEWCRYYSCAGLTHKSCAASQALSWGKELRSQ